MATNFLWYGGVGNNGLLTSVVSFMTTELESLGSSSVTVSSVNGASGQFTNSNTGQGIWADLFFNVGNPGLGTTTSGANLAGWFLTTPDGTAFEAKNAAPARAPDFVVPVPVGQAAATSTFKSQGLVLIPALQFFVLVQNNLGTAIANGGTTAPYLKAALVAMQY